MYLKQLELFGFKSFAKRTKIDFTEGVTGVVGPNGSGKSNIIDAIMWALGETSAKQLRGSRMEDVIFGGTGKKNPLGFAEVNLIFDNKDKYLDIPYEEVSIRRKIYRSGESEYYINKQKVRLKDIRTMFMDTGIGKDGYSFIGQGQIEQILSNRPQERRLVFEEAAGIAKYKSRKDESEKDLEKTLDNIQRLDDILKEVILQEKKLKTESQVARLCLEKRAEKDNIYAHILTKKELLFLESRKNLETNLLEIKEKIKNLNFKKNEIEENKEKAKANINHLEKENISLQEQRLESIQRKEAIKGQIESTSTLLKENEKEIEELTSNLCLKEEEKIEYKTKLGALREKIILSNTKLEEKNSSFEDEKFKLKELQKSLREEKDLQKDLNKEEKNWIEKKSIIYSKIESLEYFIKEKTSRQSALEEQKYKFSLQLEEIETELGQKVNEVHNFQSKSNISKIENKSLEEKKSFLEEEIRDLENQIQLLSNEYETIQRELFFLKRVHENHEGYSQTVRNFLRISKNDPTLSSDLIGPVADNLKVEQGYETAISLALGAGAQNIIISNDQNVGNMIQLLKQNNLGRLTFYPLNTMERKHVDSWIYSKTNVEFELALDKIQYEKELEPIFSNLLGRILVVKDLDDGKTLSKDLSRKYRIVSKKGDVFQIGGSISGGSVKTGQLDLYNRKTDIENKESILEEKSKKLESLKADHFEKKGVLEDILKQYSFLQENIKDSLNSITKYQNIITNLNGAKDSLESRLKEIEIQIETEKKLIVENRQTLEKLKNDSYLLEIEQSNLVEKTTLNKADKLEIEFNQQQDLVTNIKIEINKEESNLREFSILESQYKLRIVEANDFLSHTKVEIKILTKEIAEKKEKLSEYQKKISDLEKMVSNLEETLNNKISQKKTIEDELIKEEEKEKEFYSSLSRLERKEEQHLVRIEDLKTQLDEFKLEKQRFFSEYQLPIKESNKSLNELEKLYKDLEKEILSFGPINENAIPEYTEISERLEFLKHQRNDLLVSKDKLEAIIRDLEKEMRKLFKEAIAEIQVYFNEIFIQLFNGGNAKVLLEEGEDLLETGIEIQVQPPGKKLQSLTLLSGGERSMTAVALLFALLKRRVSPFCILDEIDAALDEANIKRYTNYLKKMNKMQFIMITHRKTTMEIAERLYGITMQEEGVSSVLSMELEEAEKHVGMDKKETKK